MMELKSPVTLQTILLVVKPLGKMNLMLELALCVIDGVNVKIQDEPCSMRVLNELMTVPTELEAKIRKEHTWRSTERRLTELCVTRNLYFFEEGCYRELTRNGRVDRICYTVYHHRKVSCNDGLSSNCKSVQTDRAFGWRILTARRAAIQAA